MSKARILANLISDNAELADGQISVAEVVGAAPLANPTFTGTLTAPNVSLVGVLPTSDFGAMLLSVAVGNPTDPVAVGTWFESTASDGFKYGDLDKSGSLSAYDGSLVNQLSAGVAAEAVTARWTNIIVPSLVTQSWYADLVANGTLGAGGTLDLTNGWTIEQEAGNLHISKDDVTKLDLASDGALQNPVATNIDLTAIAKDIEDTAVDVFVYDTSLDSDSGAWRKRTQATSWYNETLNTATRGSRKEFPAVAVIVAESTQVTIYDGDDPDLPMWMVFNRAGDSYFISSSQTVTSIAMQNGLFIFGTSTTGTREINFVSDLADIRRHAATATHKRLTQPIVGRNSNVAIGAILSANYLVSGNVNDVAMTVLPNAPIDAATGLPVPTMA